MDFTEKVIDKKEELLDEFENLKLEELSIKIKQILNREDDVLFKIACLAARVSVLNQRIQKIVSDNTANDNIVATKESKSVNIVEKILKPSKKATDIQIGRASCRERV